VIQPEGERPDVNYRTSLSDLEDSVRVPFEEQTIGVPELPADPVRDDEELYRWRSIRPARIAGRGAESRRRVMRVLDSRRHLPRVMGAGCHDLVGECRDGWALSYLLRGHVPGRSPPRKHRADRHLSIAAPFGGSGLR